MFCLTESVICCVYVLLDHNFFYPSKFLDNGVMSPFMVREAKLILMN